MNMQNYTQEEILKTTWVLAKLNLSSRSQNPANGSSTDTFSFLFLAVPFGAPVYWHLDPRTYQSLILHLWHLHRQGSDLIEKHMGSSLAGSLWCPLGELLVN